MNHNPGAGEKLLLIHADDIGICHAANQAAFGTMEFGLVKSGSIMMPCPWVNEVAAYFQRNPAADFGLHLTINSEWQNLRWGPVASRDKVNSLLDREGCFWRSPADTRSHAKSNEIEIELTAQIEKALLLGFKPTHMDFHMGTLFLNPEWVEIAWRLSDRYRIPLTMVRWSSAFSKREVESRGVPPEYMKSLLESYDARGISNIDDFISVVNGVNLQERRENYFQILRNLKPGISKLVIHPGLENDEMKHMMEGAADGLPKRAADYRVFTDTQTRELITSLDIRLVGWRDILPTAR